MWRGSGKADKWKGTGRICGNGIAKRMLHGGGANLTGVEDVGRKSGRKKRIH